MVWSSATGAAEFLDGSFWMIRDLAQQRRSRRGGASLRQRWRRLGLILSLWGMIWGVPAFSLALRAAGADAISSSEAGESEVPAPTEDPANDGESLGVIATRPRSRISRDVAVLHGVDLIRVACESAVFRRSFGGRAHPVSLQSAGQAVRLPLRC
jgi:hypothetical protein